MGQIYKMYRPDGRSSTRSRGSVGTSHVAKPDPVKPSSVDHANISTLKDALCVDNKDIAASQHVEVEAHVAVTTNVILEDLQVSGDCYTSPENPLLRNRRDSWYYNSQTGVTTPIDRKIN